MNVLAEIAVGPVTVQSVVGDITREEVDAIVNAANEYLQHGGGVAGAIVRAGGQVIQEESDHIGHTPTGSAVVTTAGALRTRFVIHAVGPVWRGGGHDEDNLLRSAVRSVLMRATELGLSSIAIPAISSGIFGFPKPRCARIIWETICIFLAETTTTIRLIKLTNIDLETAEFFREIIQEQRRKRGLE